MKKYVLFFPCQKDFWQGFRIIVLIILSVVFSITKNQAQIWTDDLTFSVTTGQGQVGVSTTLVFHVKTHKKLSCQ